MRLYMGWQAILVPRVMNKQHILTEIKRTAASNGGVPLGVSKFSKETGIKDSDWRGKIWQDGVTPFERPDLNPTNCRRLTAKIC
jgi:hypothetical protein